MSKDTMMAYWIEAETGNFCVQSMGTNDIFRGGTYESEIRLKYAHDPLEIVVIPLSQHESDWAKSARQRLRDKSAELQRLANGNP